MASKDDITDQEFERLCNVQNFQKLPDFYDTVVLGEESTQLPDGALKTTLGSPAPGFRICLASYDWPKDAYIGGLVSGPLQEQNSGNLSRVFGIRCADDLVSAIPDWGATRSGPPPLIARIMLAFHSQEFTALKDDVDNTLRVIPPDPWFCIGGTTQNRERVDYGVLDSLLSSPRVEGLHRLTASVVEFHIFSCYLGLDTTEFHAFRCRLCDLFLGLPKEGAYTREARVRSCNWELVSATGGGFYSPDAYRPTDGVRNKAPGFITPVIVEERYDRETGELCWVRNIGYLKCD